MDSPCGNRGRISHAGSQRSHPHRGHSKCKGHEARKNRKCSETHGREERVFFLFVCFHYCCFDDSVSIGKLRNKGQKYTINKCRLIKCVCFLNPSIISDIFWREEHLLKKFFLMATRYNVWLVFIFWVLSQLLQKWSAF